ncbi:pyruvate dehydrogenase complex dihydrolipoamide acetyltransferase component (E2) [Coemansia thaxteri]|nr:pyruvate dehydrogenase complex dihydrolipoamide acetyltransferase component (E2) [Coemansia thaxteri]
MSAAASTSSQTVARLLSRSAKLAAPAVTARLSARLAARHITTSSRVISRSAASLRSSNVYAPASGMARQYSSKSYPDHQVVGMPALSPTMTQGNVGQWQKSVGDKIEPGDVLVEIETDKAQMDFLLLPLLPLLPHRRRRRPLAKTLAREKGIDLAQVKGSGPRGRIIKADIESYVVSGADKTAAAPAAAAAPTASSTAPAAPKKAAAAATPAAASSAGFTDIPVSNMRKVIATRLTEAKATIPHYYLTQTITMDNVNKLRASLNTAANGAYKLSVNDFVVKAAASALRDVPEVNSSWQGEFIRQHHHADIAVAAATPNGLITPIVRTCDAKGLKAIAADVRDLVARARANKLKPEEFQGGSFTISNLGMYGISSFSAIINPPHAAILSVGTTEPRLVLDEAAEKGFRSVEVMSVQLSADHRVVDGATGAQFLKAFKGYLENPLTLLL